MRLLCISHSLDKTGFEMIKYLQTNGIEVYTTVWEGEESIANDKTDKSIPIPYFKKKINLKTILALRKAIIQNKIDLIYSPSSAGLSNGLFAALFTKAKIVAYRGTQARIRRSDLSYYLGILNPAVSHVICENQSIYDYLLRFFKPTQLSINCKPYQIEWVEDAIKHPVILPEIPTDAFQVIYIANTLNRPYKGLTQLIKAIQLLKGENVHLLFIGNYTQSDYNLAQSNAAEQIHFYGEQSNALHYLPNRDLFVLPSTRDASPRTIREAMACGIPVAVTDIPGARDLVVNGETGVWIAPNSPASIAKAIKYFMENPDQKKKMGKAARLHIANNFGEDSYNQQAKAIFEKVLRE